MYVYIYIYIYGTLHSKLEKITVRLTYMFKHGEGIGPAFSYAVGIWWILLAVAYVGWVHCSWMTDKFR